MTALEGALSRRANSHEGDMSDPDIEAGPVPEERVALLKAKASPAVIKVNASATAANSHALPAARSEASSSHLDTIKSVASVVIWYTSNIGLLILNKYMLSGFGFRRPVFLTLWHMIACTLLSGLLAVTGAVPVQHITSARQFGKVAVLALVFCLSVVLGNISLKLIPVSFNQAIGATTPIFTAVMALLMLGQRETRRVYLALVPVVVRPPLFTLTVEMLESTLGDDIPQVGIVLATGAEPSFHMAGFLAAVFATAARAFKSILQGLLLTDPSEKLDSMDLLRYMTPIASAALMVLVAILEPDVGNSLPKVGDPSWVTFYAILAANGALAFFVNLTNFLVTRYTSALTLQVLGNGKGVIAVFVSIMVFQNPWTLKSMGGYAIATVGVAVYMQEKRKAKAAAAAAAQSPARKLQL